MEKVDHVNGMVGYIRPNAVRDIVILAFGYFIAGYIGISLAVPPGYATIIWPASGIALCALLMHGSRLLPGVWLGSFLLNAMTGFDSSVAFEASWNVLVIGATIAAGASLQAWVGLWTARSYASGLELSDLRQLMSATLFVIILPCFIAPSVGVLTLFIHDAIGSELVLSNWLTWFAGDLFGVLLIMPILLLSSRSPVPVQWRGRALQGANSLVAISLASTLLVTFYAWQFISEREYRQAEENLADIAASTDEALRYRLQIYQRALESGAAFVTVNGGATPSEWRAYVARKNIEASYPGMRGLGLFEGVPNDDLPAFREEFERDFGDRFAIHPRVEREQHFIINRIEPLENNLAALGLDLSFEHGRREAIELSKTRREPVLTRPIVLVQDARQGAGFLLMHPISDDGGKPTGQWVYAPLVAEELLADLTPQQGTEFGLEVFYGSEAKIDDLLYATQINANTKFEVWNTISLAGQPFSLRWTSMPSFERRASSSAPLVALVSGLLITVLLGILLWTFQRRESHVIREVNKAIAELAERNRMLKMAEATAHIGHWHLDLATNDIRWSDEVYRLHGLQIGDTPALTDAIEFYHPDDRRLVQQSIETAISTHQSYQFKARLLPAHGKMRHVEVRARVELGDNKQPVSIIGVIIDRTEETEMRERLTETIEEARAADRAKSTFLANMSHEIRTPMNGVIGFTELALSEEDVPEQKRRLQMIADSGNAMLRLLNDLLDFAKIEAKQMAIVNEATDIRHTLRSCQRLMGPVATAQNLQLSLDVDPAIPAHISIDKMRLRQIVLNLVGNALKFTEKGEVRISAFIGRRQSDTTDTLFVSVRDTGIGIPEDRLASIFGKFTQADDTTARRFGGTGLGLPISAELAGLMGGDLSVESVFGRGSTFTLALPLIEKGNIGAPILTADETTEGCGHSFRLNILVAEDNPVNQELTMAMVEKAGHDCSLVENGQQAVESVLSANRDGNPFDLVLMDMQMPKMDGLEATMEIREAGIDGKTLPIVAVTANAYADDIQRCADAGMQAHLSKPLRLNKLCEAISSWAPFPLRNAGSSPDQIEEETDPRLRAMFEDRKRLVLNAIDDALSNNHPGKNELRREIANLVHQVAGVAAYFGQEALGEFCRAMQNDILEAADHVTLHACLRKLQERLAEPAVDDLTGSDRSTPR